MKELQVLRIYKVLKTNRINFRDHNQTEFQIDQSNISSRSPNFMKSDRSFNIRSQDKGFRKSLLKFLKSNESFNTLNQQSITRTNKLDFSNHKNPIATSRRDLDSLKSKNNFIAGVDTSLTAINSGRNTYRNPSVDKRDIKASYYQSLLLERGGGGGGLGNSS